jgi:hypothetical protein
MRSCTVSRGCAKNPNLDVMPPRAHGVAIDDACDGELAGMNWALEYRDDRKQTGYPNPTSHA